MKIFSKIIFLVGFLFYITVAVYAQLTPQYAITKIKRGINIGNSLDAIPTETGWGNSLIQKCCFDDYVNAYFKCLRTPFTWKVHVSNYSPFTLYNFISL